MNERDSLQRAVSRSAQDDILHEALDRIDGAPAPVRDQMQAAMGRESQVRAAIEVLARRG